MLLCIKIDAYEQPKLTFLLVHDTFKRVYALDRINFVGHSEVVDVEFLGVLKLGGES